MQADPNLVRRSIITNQVLEYRLQLEMNAHNAMELKKLREYGRIKYNYYTLHPSAIRYNTICEEIKMIDPNDYEDDTDVEIEDIATIMIVEDDYNGVNEGSQTHSHPMDGAE